MIEKGGRGKGGSRRGVGRKTKSEREGLEEGDEDGRVRRGQRMFGKVKRKGGKVKGGKAKEGKVKGEKGKLNEVKWNERSGREEVKRSHD